MIGCPPADILNRLGTDALGDVSFAALEAHIEECLVCQATLERRARDDGASTRFSARTRTAGFGRAPEIPGFVLGRELGRGGMGAVYEAWQPELARHVAIKILPGGDADSGHGRWLREARAASRIRHRNVVQIFQVGECNGWGYLVFDLIPGGSLKERLSGPLPHRLAAQLLEATSLAVDYIHTAGLMHLDIKPSNILLDGPPDGPLDAATPMIADFGIARLKDDPVATLTAGSAGFGTPAYMAPEQIRGEGKTVGPAADIFALGATLYHLLTGRPPFLATSVVETLDQLRQREPVPPRTLIPELPRDLETICLKCLQKDPERRYVSARELAEDLTRWLHGRPIAARRVPAIERARVWCVRRPVIVALAATLLVTVSASFAGLIALLGRSETQRARAETARATAEENARFASRALAELNDMLFLALREERPPSQDRILATVRAVREEASTLRGHGGVGANNLANLAMLEHHLAAELVSRGEHGEARALYQDAIGMIEESLRLAPNDPKIASGLVDALIGFADLEVEFGRRREALELFDRAAALYVILPVGSRPHGTILSIYRMRGRIADDYAREGNPRFLERTGGANLQLVEVLLRSSSDDPEAALFASLVHEDRGDAAQAEAALRDAAHRLGKQAKPCEELRRSIVGAVALIADPFARQIEQRLRPGAEGNLSAWSETFLNLLSDRSAVFGLDRSAVPLVGLEIAESASHVGARYRRTGRLDDSHRTADRLMAMAEAFVRRYPRDAVSYFILSKAHAQKAKNAWKVEDRAAVRRAMVAAVESARRASSLDSQRKDIPQHLAELGRRLARLDHTQ